MKIKKIKNYEDYYVDTNGNVYSTKSGKLKKLKPWLDSKGRYLMVSLCNNNEIKKYLVHRLVAQTFICNTDETKGTVDHIDNNPRNNKLENLRWLSQKENTKRGFETRTPVRNFKVCALIKDRVFVKYFRSVKEASRFANKNYKTSVSGLEKHRQSQKNGVKIINF